MTHGELQKIILTCIPSESLKRAIRERNILFEYPDLLTVAYRYARTFDERIRFLELIAAHADEEVSVAARRIDDYEKRKLTDLKTPAAGEVYELTVTERGKYEHRQLCDSFETALSLFLRFMKEYFKADDPKEAADEIRHAAIIRRKMAKAEDETDLAHGFDDETIWGTLNPAGEIEKVDNDLYDRCPDGAKKTEPEDDEYTACDLCDKICPYDRVVPFPEYLKNGDIVRCREDGETMTCVWLRTDSDEPDDNIERYYVLHLNGKSMKERIWRNPETKYDVFFNAHYHPSAPDTEKIEISDLDEETREIYLDFMRFYEEYEREREIARQKGESGE